MIKRNTPRLFHNVAGAAPGRSVFDLSYIKKFTCDMGQLIPIMHDEAVPGDIWNIGNEMLIRFQTMVAPIMHQVDVYVHYFFVPYRLLWDEWEDFITGGSDGTLEPHMPKWNPTRTLPDGTGYASGTLWDYLGFPVGYHCLGSRPIDLVRRAYYFIYNEFYRDQTLQNEIDWEDMTETMAYEILNRNWTKDYFTSALPWQQRGTSPAIPLSGTSLAEWATGAFIWGTPGTSLNVNVNGDPSLPYLYANDSDARNNLQNMFNSNVVDLSLGDPLDIADLRLSFQIQKFLERNARAGARYTEFLGAHFGVHPRDDRLDRPEYIGGTKSSVVISEVLQTSESDATPQGNLVGHGINASGGFAGKYRVEEFGVIYGLMSIMPKPAYQQGVNRQFVKRETRYEFYFPEFAHLSEQAIERSELFANNNEADNETIFGYCGAFDEMRVKHDIVCGQMRDVYDYWHLGRQFATYPELNSDFVTCVPRKDIFAAPSEPACIVEFGNCLKAIRPLPIIAEPGLIDHG